MLTRFFAIVAWLAVGHAVLAALFWGLLQVPESTIFMVALSGLLVALLLAVAAWVEVFALLSSSRGRVTGEAIPASTVAAEAPTPGEPRIRTAVKALPAFVVALAVFGIVFGVAAQAGTWLAGHRGEIDAWMIVHLKAVKTAPLHATLGWILWFLRYGVGLSLSLALLLHLATSGLGAIRRRSWLGDGLRPRRLLLVAVWMFVFVWLPWQAVYWRPKALPPTWLEPAFVTTKLLMIYLLGNIGWALALKTTSGGWRD